MASSTHKVGYEQLVSDFNPFMRMRNWVRSRVESHEMRLWVRHEVDQVVLQRDNVAVS
jgi:hypothetical protein